MNKSNLKVAMNFQGQPGNTGDRQVMAQTKQKVRKQAITPIMDKGVPIAETKEKCQSPEVLENKDVEFEVEGRLIAANRATLCMVSPVLKTLLKGSFQESGLSRIHLHGKKYNAFIEFVEVTHVHKQITAANVHDILPLVHEYQMLPLLDTCETILLNEVVSLSLYYLADRYNLQTLYKKCLVSLPKQNYFHLKREEKSAYEMLSKDAKIAYLEATMEAQLQKQTYHH